MSKKAKKADSPIVLMNRDTSALNRCLFLQREFMARTKVLEEEKQRLEVQRGLLEEEIQKQQVALENSHSDEQFFLMATHLQMKELANAKKEFDDYHTWAESQLKESEDHIKSLNKDVDALRSNNLSLRPSETPAESPAPQGTTTTTTAAAPNLKPTEEQMREVVNKIMGGWYSVNSAHVHTHIGVRALNKAVERAKKGYATLLVSEKWWTKEMDEILSQKLRDLGMTYQSPRYMGSREDIASYTPPEEVPGSIEKLIYEIHFDVRQKEKGEVPLTENERAMCSARMVKTILANNKTYKVTKIRFKTDWQNSRRTQANTDPYNFLSLAIQSEIIFPKTYKDSLVYNYDKSTIYLQQNNSGMIVNLACVVRELHSQHINPKFTLDMSKSRTAPFGVLTNSAGELRMFILFIKDEKFNTHKTLVHSMSLRDNMMAIFYGTKCDSELELEREIFETIIVSIIKEDQKKVKENIAKAKAEAKAKAKAKASASASTAGAAVDSSHADAMDTGVEDPNSSNANNDSNASATATAAAVAKPTEQEEEPFALLTFDGEDRQIKAIMKCDAFLDPSTNIHALKLPGGTSMGLQPNDVMSAFSKLKKNVKASVVEKIDLSKLPLKDYMLQFKAHLEEYKLDTMSIVTYTHFLYLLHFYVPECYSQAVILRGWELTGLGGMYQHQSAKIMKKWPGWGYLIPETQQQPILEGITSIANRVLNSKHPERYHGEVVDSKMEKVFAPYVGNANKSSSHACSEIGKYSICLNQWRALIIGSRLQEFIKKRKAAKEAMESAKNPAANFYACVACPATMNRAKNQRGAPDGWKRCACEKHPHFYCSEPACLDIFDKHRAKPTSVVRQGMAVERDIFSDDEAGGDDGYDYEADEEFNMNEEEDVSLEEGDDGGDVEADE